MMNAAITAAAQACAAAQAGHDKAREELARVEVPRNRIQARLNDLAAQRSAIVERRRAGDVQPDDAGTVALIDADAEGLRLMLADAEAVVGAAMTPVQEAAAALTTAQHYLRVAEHEAMETALLEHATRLDELMVGTLEQLRELHSVLGRGKPAWCPSQALAAELRRLQAAAGRL